MTAEEERKEDGPGGGAPPAGVAPLDQAFDAGSLYALRSAVAAHAAAAGLGRQQVYTVTSVAHELAANAVVHGAGHGRLRLWVDGGFLCCQVTDDGRDGTAAGNGAEWPVEHGHGLWVAGRLADEVRISHGPVRTTVTARFPFPGDAPGR